MSLRIHLGQKNQKNAKRILHEHLEKCRTALGQEDAHQAVHEARKEMKKLRAFSRLMRAEIGQKTYRMTNMYYRDLAQILSPARDASAMLDTLKSLAENFTEEREKKAFQDIKNHLISRKSAASRTQIKGDDLLNKLKTDLGRAEKIHGSWKVKRDDFSAFRGGLSKTYKRCQKAMKKAYKKKTPEAFHEWRKRAKYLRYQVDYLREIWHHPMKGLEKELHQLTDYLGKDHDLLELCAHIRQMDYEDQKAIHSIIAIINRQKEHLRLMAKPLGAKLLLDSKKDFISRLEHYWKESKKEIRIQQENQVLAEG